MASERQAGREGSSICTSAVSALLTKRCYFTLQGPVNNYSKEESKHDVIVCYCIHLGGRRHGSQLLNQLEQGIEVSIGARKPGLLELPSMLCSYVPFLSPSGGEYLIVSYKMEELLEEGWKKAVTPYSTALRCFLYKANYHHVNK